MILSDRFQHTREIREVKNKLSHKAFKCEKLEDGTYKLKLKKSYNTKTYKWSYEYFATIDKKTLNKEYYLHDSGI